MSVDGYFSLSTLCLLSQLSKQILSYLTPFITKSQPIYTLFPCYLLFVKDFTISCYYLPFEFLLSLKIINIGFSYHSPKLFQFHLLCKNYGFWAANGDLFMYTRSLFIISLFLIDWLNTTAPKKILQVEVLYIRFYFTYSIWFVYWHIYIHAFMCIISI